MSVQEGLVLSQPPIYDCFNDRPEIEPNCDIAGLGILVGFLAPAYLALIIITVHYLVAFDQNKNPDHGMVGSDQDCEMQRLRPSRVQSSNQPVTSPTNAVAELNSEESIQRRNEADCSSSSQPTSLGLREEMTIPQSDRDLPDHQTVCNYEAESDEEWSPNPIDQFILGSRLTFCDGQSITGLAILSSAFATLGGPSGIPAYQWQIAAHLAWLANITHLVGLTFLRDYLRQRPLHRNVRQVPTTILQLLLLVALFPTGWFNWLYSDRHEGANPASPSSYARCFFNVQTATQRALDSSDMRVGFPEGSGSSTVFSILFLSMSFGIRLIKLSRRGSDFFRDVIRRNARRKLLQLAVDTTARFKPTSPRLNFVRQYFFVNPIIAILMTARIHTDVVTSTFSEVMLAWVAVLWVTIRIVATRASVQLDENGFTFGEIIAVLLLTGPTIAAATASLLRGWEKGLLFAESLSSLSNTFLTHTIKSTSPCIITKKTLELANKSMSYQAPWTYLIVMTVLWTTIWCLVAIVLAATFFLNLRYVSIVYLFYNSSNIFFFIVMMNLFGTATMLGEDVASSDPNGERNSMPS
ncbi:hypothetical protein BN1723_013060, partial [Verticillium longisporum]